MKIMLYICFLLVSCTANSKYLQVKKAMKIYNKEHDDIISLSRGWNPSRIILNRLSRFTSYSSNYIYIYCWDDTGNVIGKRDFYSLYYNVSTNDVIYYCNNGKSIVSSRDSVSFVVGNFILRNYINDRHSYLKEIQHNYDLSHNYTLKYFLFDVKGDKSEVHVYEAITLDMKGNLFK